MANLPRNERWKLVRGSSIPSSLRLTLYVLNCFQGDNETVFSKRETIADEVGCDKGTLSHKMKALEELGVIKRVWKHRNHRASREYAIQYEQLRFMQRSTLTNSTEWDESTLSKSTGLPCQIQQGYGVEIDSHEDPLNIQGTFTLQNSPNSGRASREKRTTKADSNLIAFCHEWNAWHSAGIVRQKIRDANSPGKGIEDAWKRAQRDSEQRDRLSDFRPIREAITASQQFLKDAGWFDAAGLIGGKNANRRWYADQLMAGAYHDKPNTGNGGRVPSSESSQAWQKTLDAIRANPFDRKAIDDIIGNRASQALKSIGGAKQIEKANDIERRELERRFHQAFSQE